MPNLDRRFACRGLRMVWELLTDPRSRAAVEVAERFCDGKATEDEMSVAYADAYAAAVASTAYAYTLHVASTAAVDAHATAAYAYVAAYVAAYADDYVGAAADLVAERCSHDRKAQADALRNIYGNPFAKKRAKA